MPLLTDLENKIGSFFKEKYEIEETTIVPATDYSKLTFGNKGLKAELAFLFADIRKSSKLVDTYGYENAARIYQSFHDINVRIIAANDGKVRAFDGDRVMGVFAGDFKNGNSVKAAMQIQSAIRNILNKYLKVGLSCGIGIDYGTTLITKVGKGRDPDNQDLVWVGQACNYASHLCQEANNTIIISERSYNKLHDTRKLSGATNMWTNKKLTLKNSVTVNCYESSYEWKID